MKSKKKPAKKTFFVYQNWTDEKLFKSGLTREEANEEAEFLDRLIEDGCCGNGCACIGDTDDPGSYNLCLRLGLTPTCKHE